MPVKDGRMEITMEINVSKRLDMFQTGIFASLNEKKEEYMKTGKKMYNLFVGTPDFKVPEHIQSALIDSAKSPENFHYSCAQSYHNRQKKSSCAFQFVYSIMECLGIRKSWIGSRLFSLPAYR